jgi:hypothetical protein
LAAHLNPRSRIERDVREIADDPYACLPVRKCRTIVEDHSNLSGCELDFVLRDSRRPVFELAGLGVPNQDGLSTRINHADLPRLRSDNNSNHTVHADRYDAQYLGSSAGYRTTLLGHRATSAVAITADFFERGKLTADFFGRGEGRRG